jgi:alkanesulfonate monooxygenase SsuD/methylene tetrahydromethanopterin reductase-like flavin-dependent oxidoreductase (luciferase family)
MEIGVALDVVWPWPRIRRLAQVAGEYGYDQLWLSDHPLGRDPFLTLLDLAGLVPGARLGVATVNPSARHPAVLAASAATVSHHTGGRFWLGLGSSNASLLGPIGLETARPAARCREAAVIIRQLLEARHSTFRGTLFSTTGARPLFEDIAPVPVLIGTSGGPGMLRVSAEVAHGIVVPAGTRQFYRHVIEAFGRARRAAGRTDVPPVVAIVTVGVADSPATAREGVRPMVAQTLAYRAKTPHALQAMGLTAAQVRAWTDAPRSLPESVIREAAVTGTPSDCVDGLRRLAALGVTQAVVRFPDEAALHAIGARIMPVLRDHVRHSRQ